VDVATLRQSRRPANPALDTLCAALVGLLAGLALGGEWRTLYALLALVTGG
jgi:hypothetical protein